MVKPQNLKSPYEDYVRVPKASNINTMSTVHCINTAEVSAEVSNTCMILLHKICLLYFKHQMTDYNIVIVVYRMF